MSDISKIDLKLRLETIEWFISRVMAQFSSGKIGRPTNHIDEIREQAQQYVDSATRGDVERADMRKIVDHFCDVALDEVSDDQK